MQFDSIGFFTLGIAVGSLGTIIGAGGGFILIPILIYLYPEMSAASIASIGILAVAANASSGSIAYAIKKKIHWPSAMIFTLAALPGLTLGVHFGSLVPRQQYEFIFGGVLLALGIFLLVRHTKKQIAVGPPAAEFSLAKAKIFLGSAISLVVGFIASFLGIGGGIIHVPLMSEVLGFPIYLATGTSHFILASTALFAVLEHFRLGHYSEMPGFVPYLIVGLVMGAQVGAHYASKVRGKRILQILAAALIIVGLRLLFRIF